MRFIDPLGLEGEDPDDEKSDEQKLVEYYRNLGYDVNNLNDVKAVVNKLNSTFESDREKSGNQSNWTGGGHWNGSGEKPNVYSNRTFEQGSSSITYDFANNDACAAWAVANDEQNLRVSVMSGVVFAFVPGGKYVAIPIGLGGAYAIGKFLNEGSSNVFPGYSINYTICFKVTKSTHPWGENSISFDVKFSFMNEKGGVINKYNYSTTLNLDPVEHKQLYRSFETFNNSSTTLTNPLPNEIIR